MSVARGLLGATGPIEAAGTQVPAAAAAAAAATTYVEGLLLQQHLALPLLLQRAYTLGYESLGKAATASLKGHTVLVTGSTE